jgi:hypothetical protein
MPARQINNHKKKINRAVFPLMAAEKRERQSKAPKNSKVTIYIEQSLRVQLLYPILYTGIYKGVTKYVQYDHCVHNGCLGLSPFKKKMALELYYYRIQCLLFYSASDRPRRKFSKVKLLYSNFMFHV